MLFYEREGLQDKTREDREPVSDKQEDVASEAEEHEGQNHDQRQLQAVPNIAKVASAAQAEERIEMLDID